MDFFERQDTARRKTGLLTVYFMLAVVLMIVALYLVVVGLFGAATTKGEMDRVNWFDLKILLGVSGLTLIVIGLGSLYKIVELRGGGERVATMLGGRRINPNTGNPAERKVLNVVEEMAIASGVPVPPVYVLEEDSINAFAAGYTTTDAVIGVNRGTIELLSRDELQGVIAHEFSHILNGDMRLNIRLIGLLNGILLFAIIGYYIMRVGAVSGHSRSRNDKGGGGAYILILGLAAMAIGFIGLLFARLIKAAVSRQREYLADASAVQFTRNPDGIAGALKKIGGLSQGSRMETAEAETASHMFFGSAFKSSMFGGFATHPPLTERIKRIDSHFNGKFPKTVPPQEEAPRPAPSHSVSSQGSMKTPMGGMFGAHAGGDKLPLDPVMVMAGIGVLGADQVDYSHNLIESIPALLLEAIHDTFSARCAVFALLLESDQETRNAQLQLIEQHEGQPSLQETLKLQPLVEQLGQEGRLPMIEMVQSSLHGLSPQQYQKFHDTVERLVKADDQISFFEFILQRILLSHLDRHFQNKKPPPVYYRSLRGLLDHIAGLISCLSHVGHTDDGEYAEAFAQATEELTAHGAKLQLLPRKECSLEVLAGALDELSHSSSAIKKLVLKSAAICIAADGQVTVNEAELFRAIADSLDCPVPPIAAGPIVEAETV